MVLYIEERNDLIMAMGVCLLISCAAMLQRCNAKCR